MACQKRLLWKGDIIIFQLFSSYSQLFFFLCSTLKQKFSVVMESEKNSLDPIFFIIIKHVSSTLSIGQTGEMFNCYAVNFNHLPPFASPLYEQYNTCKSCCAGWLRKDTFYQMNSHTFGYRFLFKSEVQWFQVKL